MGIIISNQGTEPVDIDTTAGEHTNIGAGGNCTIELGNGFTVLPHGAAVAEPVVSPQGGQPEGQLEGQPEGQPGAVDTVAPVDASDASVVRGGALE